jgi:outer membrane biosynthesis protein TonB
MAVRVWVLGNPWVLHPNPNPNPTRVESGLGAGFIFHPQVHLKPEEKPKRNPKKHETQKKPEKNSKPEKTRKKPKKILKETHLQNPTGTEPDPKPDRFGFGCQISPAGSGVKFNPTTFFHGSCFRST